MNVFYDFVTALLGLGLEPKELTFVQVSLRGVIIFFFTLVMVRLSSKRSLAEKTAFDAILLVILASVLSRAINGTAGFFTSIGCSFVLVFLHRFFAWIACRSHAFGKIIKGCPAVIIQNGQVDLAVMRRNQISQHDLEEDLRLEAKTEDLAKIKVARLERSGDVSFIKAE
ncbi:MAG TPA: YetF domain-containing protein [Chthoniobacterales bacterium]|nr:YetF domain-containing protein [Chthoniobacterales bacterium]